MGELRVLDGTGDTKLIWDAENDAEVAAARKMYDDLIAKGHTAYSVKKTGKTGKKIDAFDPAAERIILVPRMAGG